MKTTLFSAATATAVLAAALAGCSARSDSTADSTDGDLKIGPGVSASTIRLAAFADLSGPYAAAGKSDIQGIQLAFDEVNAAGGVCDRDLELDVTDHGFNVQTAVTSYTRVAPDVLGFGLLVGSSIAAALDTQIREDEMLTAITYATPQQLTNPFIMMPHTTNEYAAINGVAYLMGEGLLNDGDALGHIYFEGDSGATALLGTEYMAEEHDLTLVKQQIAVTDTDLSAAISALLAKDVKAIELTAGPTQLASAAALLAARGVDIPIVANIEAWTPALLDTPAGAALTKSAVIVSPNVTYESDVPAAAALRTAFEEKYPDEAVAPTLMWAYAYTKVYIGVLEQACENQDLTRAGVAQAYRELATTDADGLSVPLDYSKEGQSPSIHNFISVVDADTEDGLRTAKDASASEDAAAYLSAHQ